MADTKAKLPPQNIEAEQSVLGSLLIDKDAIIKVAERLEEGDFYRGAHQKIYAAVLRLFERREPADVVTVSDELKDMGELKNIGGDSYLTELVNRVPTAAHIASYAEIVKENSVRRRLIGIANTMTNDSYKGAEPVGKLLEKTEKNIFGISQEHLTRNFTPIRDTLTESFDRLEELHKSDSSIRGIPTGFRDIDNRLAGLQEANLILLAARPSVGKSSLALNIAQYITVHENIPVGFFSLEMSKQELVDRLLASQANVDNWKIKTGNLKEEDFAKLGEAMGILADAPLFIDDTPGQSVLEMRTKARRLQMEQEVKIIIIDYLQLAVSRGLENRVQEVSEISQGMKNIARELNCPVLSLSQLSRGVEQRGEPRPQLSDLRASGCLTGDTQVQLSDGRRVPIKEVVELSAAGKDVELLALNTTTQKLTPLKIRRAWHTGKKRVFKLKTQLGREIKASANHKFRTLTEWKPLGELAEGERLALPRNLNALTAPKSTMTKEELALLGHLIGDGCTLPNHALQYTTNQEELAEGVVELSREIFSNKIAPRINKERSWWQVYLSAADNLARGRRNPIAKWLDKLGIWGLRSHEKFIPEEVFNQSAEYLEVFARHLWATDGSLGVVGKKKPRAVVYYATSSKRLARDVGHLLLRLGILSRSSLVSQGDKGRDQWHVTITGKPDVMAFVRRVGVVGPKQGKLDEIIDFYERRDTNTNRDVIPREAWRELVEPARKKAGLSQREMQAKMGLSYNGSALYKNGIGRERALKVAEIVESQTLKDLAGSDIYWDKIANIEPLGEEEVYDLEVPGVHNFVAEDFIVHNSLEQDADVVMFLWRPQEDDKERPDQIKLTIAKHRNGPTGEIDLIFRGEQTRFYSMEKHREG